MLSKSRIVAIFALGLASTLIAVGILLPRLFPEETPVPLGLQHTTLSLRDPKATVGTGYLALGEDKKITAPVVRQFNIELGEPASENEATARVGVSNSRENVKDDLESLLDAQVYSYRLNRVTGQAVGDAKVSDTPATPPSKTSMPGYWAKFPIDTQQQTYDYFDWTLRQAFPAHFKGTETHQTTDGKDMQVYLFHQDIEPTKVSDRVASFRSSIHKDAKRAELHHGGWREIAVEPQSGLIVGVEEHIKDDYRAKGKPVDVLLEFNGRTTESTEAGMLDQAESLGGKRSTEAWGTGLIIAGAVILVVSLVVALRRGRGRRGAGTGGATDAGDAADTDAGDTEDAGADAAGAGGDETGTGAAAGTGGTTDAGTPDTDAGGRGASTSN